MYNHLKQTASPLSATRYTLNASSGFTLIEMLIALALFAVIVVMAVGSLLSVVDASREAQAKKTVVNNLHFALENMTRVIRTGSKYHCDITATPITTARDCATDSASSLAFLSNDNKETVYRLNGSTIERSQNGGVSFEAITAPEMTVGQLQFFVDGAASAGGQQPRVLIVIGGVMQGKGQTSSSFNIETLVSQRLLDIP